MELPSQKSNYKKASTPQCSLKLKSQLQARSKWVAQTNKESQLQKERTANNHHSRNAETIKEREAELIPGKKKA